MDGFQAPWRHGTHSIYAFKDASVVDTAKGTILEAHTIVVSNGRISSVVPNEKAHIPSGAIEVNASGKYICPGLIDCHVHLSAVPESTSLDDIMTMHETAILQRQPFLCRQMLHMGFTTVRDCGGTTYVTKQAINAGVFPGPRLFLAGHALTQTAGTADYRGPFTHSECCSTSISTLSRTCDGVPECIRTSREEFMRGSDFIKIYTSGSVLGAAGDYSGKQFTAEEIKAFVEVATNGSSYVAAHAYTPVTIRHAVENGVRSIEHGNFLDEETARFMAEKQAFLVPTLILLKEMIAPEWKGFVDPSSTVNLELALRSGLNALRIAKAAGVKICYGTDLLGPLTVSQLHEFSLRAEVLDSVELLQSATVNAAELLLQSENLGQVKKGFLADMLLLNKNPLEDIAIFDRPQDHLEVVMKDGRIEWSSIESVKIDVHY